MRLSDTDRFSTATLRLLNGGKGAPPAWSNAASAAATPCAHHHHARRADERKRNPVGQVRQYDFPLAYGGGDAPTGLSLTLTGVTFSGRPPAGSS